MHLSATIHKLKLLYIWLSFLPRTWMKLYSVFLVALQIKANEKHIHKSVSYKRLRLLRNSPKKSIYLETISYRIVCYALSFELCHSFRLGVGKSIPLLLSNLRKRIAVNFVTKEELETRYVFFCRISPLFPIAL